MAEENKQNAPTQEEDDFDSLLDECTKKLDTKLTVQSQPTATSTQQTAS